jgi:DNA polymerase-1
MLELPFREVWALDTEYNFRPSRAFAYPGEPQPEGSIQHPVCLLAHELYSGRTVKLFEDEFGPAPPFDIGDGVLFIAYTASAEWLTFLALGWPLPARVFDPFIEYRRHICGTPWDLPVRGNKSLLKALEHFGIPSITADQKQTERDLVLRGGPWTPGERQEILDYCETDVTPLFRLTECLLQDDCCGAPLRSDPRGLGQALLRGRFSLSVARMQHVGIPIDNELLDRVLDNWDRIKLAIIAELDADFGVYEGEHFRNERFLACMDRLGIPWPRTTTGLPVLEKETFKDMVRRHPGIAPLHDLRQRLGDLRLENLRVGVDGRNRTGLMMFGAKTGRNTPSQSGYIFGLPAWVRHLIKPPPGWAVAYLDYKSQEYHIASMLSGDTDLLRVIGSGDPYMAFAIRAELAPAGATKHTHPDIRGVCKTLLLGTNYGMGAEAFAFKANIPLTQAEHIHSKLKRTFARCTHWSSFEVVAEARLCHWLHTAFGWRQFMDGTDVPSIRNWPMQSMGAEMLRLACDLATERDIRVCGPIHDAILIEARLEDIDAAVTTARAAMEEASREVLDGHTVPVDAEIVRWPDRYRPEKGRDIWERVLRLAEAAESVPAEA